jgi:restriction system protein
MTGGGRMGTSVINSAELQTAREPMREECIVSRAVFISQRIIDHLATERGPTDGKTSESIILHAYRRAMGEAYSDKVNLYAFRRLLAELGAERPPSTDDILEGFTALVSAPTPVPKEEIDRAFGIFIDRNREIDANDALPGEVASLRNAVTVAQDRVTLRLAEEVIRKHIKVLIRKRSQLRLTDDYGVVDESKWRAEVAYFVARVVLPALEKVDATESMIATIAQRVQQMAAEALPEELAFPNETTAILSPEEYEVYCAETLRAQGWETRLTERTGDQGIDIVASRGGIAMVVQCKKYSAPVGNGAVQEVHAGKGFLHADIGVVVSNADFTRSARELANALGILLIHDTELRELDKVLLIAFKGRK